ncbi:MAG: thio(seleno)oxazole modification radical SAM maturase SbtM, partial [Desulfuromonadaceae bacterium]|nr:selenobiotic family peptide radical SAM maturase [Geobacteraceae bacterium]
QEILGPTRWRILAHNLLRAEEFPPALETAPATADVPAYLPDMARLELARHQCDTNPARIEVPTDALSINPTLDLIEVGWNNLPAVLNSEVVEPQEGGEHILLWKKKHDARCRMAVASADDLLALKLVAERLDVREIAATQNQAVGIFDRAIEKALHKGLLLESESRLHRHMEDFPAPATTPERFLKAEAFTLQWHITQRCDLNCRHCYDRSTLQDVSYARGVTILDQMRDFCRSHHVAGQVSFSGGNPFLHPSFISLYRAAVERNLTPAILGNPVSEAQLEQLLKIEKPVFYQVSLEGLEKHNDYIRGAGNFRAVMEFLDVLKRNDVYSMVMLTLTQDNLDQVLPLAEVLRERVDLFTYNRLSMVGQGAALQGAESVDYATFVKDYLAACRDNPAMAMKDNLLNIERSRQGLELFGGCTGFGCGAAFNFVSLLPSGEVHACRKYPSPVGNIYTTSLEDIYYGETAKAYRRGSSACFECDLRPVCGGCPAVTYGHGQNPFNDIDPACFFTE